MRRIIHGRLSEVHGNFCNFDNKICLYYLGWISNRSIVSWKCCRSVKSWLIRLVPTLKGNRSDQSHLTKSLQGKSLVQYKITILVDSQSIWSRLYVIYCKFQMISIAQSDPESGNPSFIPTAERTAEPCSPDARAEQILTRERFGGLKGFFQRWDNLGCGSELDPGFWRNTNPCSLPTRSKDKIVSSLS